MITFRQFLNEETQTPEVAAELIIEHCHSFLAQSGFDPRELNDTSLFRGVGDYVDLPIFSKQTRWMQRDPVDTNRYIHNELNKYFDEKFGVEYRSEAFFVTGSEKIAENYGHAFLVFPIGNFKFIWSPKIEDAYSYFAQPKADGIPDMCDVLGKDIARESDDYVDDIGEYLRKVNPYKSNELAKAIVSRHEIMIHCDSYYALRYDSRLPDKFTERVLELL
jgi:hypothetical protein